MTWHATAEQWAVDAVTAAGLPVVRYLPTAAGPAAAMVVLIGPATIADGDAGLSGRFAADLDVEASIASPGDTEPDIAAMTEAADTITEAFVRAGANAISSRAGTINLPDRQPVPARTITATVRITGTC